MPSSIIPFIREKTLVSGGGLTTFISDAFETMDFTEVMLQLVVTDMTGPQNSGLAVSWEISNDGKNWISYPAGGVSFTQVLVQLGGGIVPKPNVQALKETNIGVYMRAVATLSEPGGTDTSASYSVTGVGRN